MKVSIGCTVEVCSTDLYLDNSNHLNIQMATTAVIVIQEMASPNWISPDEGIITWFEGTQFGCLIIETPNLMPKSGRNYDQMPNLEPYQVSKLGDSIIHHYAAKNYAS